MIKKNVSNLTKKFGVKIKLERIKRNMTQRYLADIAGISRLTIGALERGESSPSIDTIAAIADALNIEIQKLFIFDDLK